jgi:hypothetical protein
LLQIEAFTSPHQVFGLLHFAMVAMVLLLRRCYMLARGLYIGPTGSISIILPSRGRYLYYQLTRSRIFPIEEEFSNKSTKSNPGRVLRAIYRFRRRSNFHPRIRRSGHLTRVLGRQTYLFSWSQPREGQCKSYWGHHWQQSDRKRQPRMKTPRLRLK